ncbi:MAG TPA: AraC family transcriptional regulator [Clostridiales bacterium]|jgi:AraC-like DNA-binding protein|nr:AraC family transcriptional regulator [Clostridiales bacterium]
MRSKIKSYETRLEKCSNFPFYIYRVECKANAIGIYAHWHEEAEILYIDCQGTIEIEGTSYDIKENDIVFINKEQLHLVNAHTDGMIYAIVFDYDFIDFNTNDFCQINIIEPLKSKKMLFPTVINSQNNQYEQIKSYLFEMVNQYYSNIPGKQLKIKCNIYEIIFLLFSADMFHMPAEAESDYDRSQLAYVKAVIHYMEDHYNEQITIDDMAQYVSISKFHLIKIFKQITGVTPIIYLRDFRIEQSIKCLSKGYTVTQTAYMCGFNNLSYFIRAFRERFNMPPKEFQKTVL